MQRSSNRVGSARERHRGSAVKPVESERIGSPSQLTERLLHIIKTHERFHGVRPDDVVTALDEARRLYTGTA